MTKAPLLVLAALASAVLTASPARADSYYGDHYSVSFGGLVPQGPAKLGTYLGFNYGMRPADPLRVGAEMGWYRREYYSTYLEVTGTSPLSGITSNSIASTQIFPFLGTADLYRPLGSGRVDFYGGGGVGFSVLRTKHYPEFGFRSFTRSQTGFAYMLRVGISTHPGQGPGSLFSEVFYLGSTIDGEKNARAGDLADVDTRAKGVGFRVGYRW